MLFRSLIFFALVLVCGSHAASIDSSGLIFDDTKIHHYELRFYYPGWADSLVYYKSLPDEEYIPARLVYRTGPSDSIVMDSIGVRYKGNSSYAFAANSTKKPFKFSFDKFRNGRRFFNVERLNFSNGAKDPTMMREKISYDIISRFMPAPRAAFATITIEGSLIGLYTQVEQVDKIFLSRHFKDNDCNLYKSIDNGSTLLYKGPNQSSYEAEYDLKTNTTANDWSAFINMIEKLNGTPAPDFIKIAGSCLALDNACRYLAFTMVFSNFDSYTGSGRNFYFYDDSSTRKFTLIPWDLNLSFGVYTNNWNVTTADIVTISNLAQRPLNRRILENDSLRRVYLNYIQAMIDGPAGADTVAAMADRLKPFLDSCVQADSNKLHPYNDFLRNIDSNVVVQDGLTRSTIPGLKSFMAKRIAALRTQLAQYLPVKNPFALKAPAAGRLACFPRGPGHGTTIRYSLDKKENDVRLDVINTGGRSIQSFHEGAKTAGAYERFWDTRPLRSGYYMVKLTAGSKSSAIGAVLLGR